MKSSRSKRKQSSSGCAVNSVTNVLFQNDHTLISTGAADGYNVNNHQGNNDKLTITISLEIFMSGTYERTTHCTRGTHWLSLKFPTKDSVPVVV